MNDGIEKKSCHGARMDVQRSMEEVELETTGLYIRKKQLLDEMVMACMYTIPCIIKKSLR